MYLCYDLLWVVVALLLAPWWILQCLWKRSFRRMVAERLTLGLARLGTPQAGRPRVLVHGVSVGEIMASRSLVAELSPTCEVVVSASTNTGMEVARRLYPKLEVIRFPLDPSPVIRRFLRRIQPEHVILMELEVWPNFLKWSNRCGAPIAIVNGRITERSLRNYLRFHRSLPQFLRVTLFAAQDEANARRFVQLLDDDRRVVVTGNIKADGLQVGPLPQDPAQAEVQHWVAAGPDQNVLVAGSTHGQEELLVFQAFQAASPGCRVILVPRHPERAPEVIEALAALGVRAQRLTRLRSGAERLDPTEPLIVDTVGEIGRFYGLATLVFVGGSLIPHGGQNMLEPAARGKPVLYGPHTDNFLQETALLEEVGAAIRVRDAADLEHQIRFLLGDPLARERMSQAGIQVALAQRGATRRSVQALESRLGLPQHASSPE